MERLLDIKDAAEFLNVSETTIRRWTNSGTLKCYRVGGKRERRFRMRDLLDVLRDSRGHKLRLLGFNDQRLPEGSHVTHFYSGKEEALELSVPYVLEGLRHGEVVLVVMPPEKIRKLITVLQAQGRSIDRDLEEGRLNLSAGMVSPKEMIRNLAGFMDRTDKFRVLGDMIWAMGKGWDFAALGALEEAVDFMPRSESGLLLCQYSLEDFSGEYIMMAAESHRHTIYKGKMEKSPYYAQEIRE
jgi:transcriptional repressor of dcmA and dcmR